MYIIKVKQQSKPISRPPITLVKEELIFSKQQRSIAWPSNTVMQREACDVVEVRLLCVHWAKKTLLLRDTYFNSVVCIRHLCTFVVGIYSTP